MYLVSTYYMQVNNFLPFSAFGTLSSLCQIFLTLKAQIRDMNMHIKPFIGAYVSILSCQILIIVYFSETATKFEGT